MMGVVVQFILVVVIVGGSYGIVPLMTPDTVQFGVRIPPRHTDSASIAKVRKTYYAFWLLILLVGIVATVLVNVLGSGATAANSTSTTSTWGSLLTLLALILLNYVNYYAARRRLLAAKEAERWYEGVTEGLVADTDIHNQKRQPSLAWGIPAVLIAVLSIVLPALRYSALPERIAIHFNAAGVADGFAAKSFWSVFGPELTQVILVVVMLAVHLSLHRFNVRLDPSNPAASRRRYQVLQREGTKAVWVMLAIVNAGMLLTMLPLWGFAVGSVTRMAGIGAAVIPIGVVITIVWIALAAGRTRGIAAGAAKSGVVARDDDRYWVAGVFYFNRHDSALMVPKRFGIGMTINFGHPVAWVILLLIIGTPIVVSLLGHFAG